MSSDIQLAYNTFEKKCNDIVHSNFIMSSNYIMSLLRLVAQTPVLMEFVAKCNQGLSYKEEFDLAASGASFRLPTSNKRIVSLVTGMLFEIDQNSINLNSFLIKYFGTTDYEEGYKMFCKSVIEPYCEAFKMILDDEIEEDNTRDVSAVKDVALSDNIKEQIFPYISAMNEVVVSDHNLKEKKRKDYLTMLEGFYYAIEISNAKMIQVVWIGLQSVVESYRPLKSYIKSLQSILLAFDIVE